MDPLLGHTSAGRAVRVSRLDQHLVILGSTGSGKTWAGKRVVQEAVLAGDPVIVIDSQGDLASLLSRLSRRDASRLGLNPFDVARWETLTSKRVLVAGEDVGIGTALDGEPQDCAEQLVSLLKDIPGPRRIEAVTLVMQLLERGHRSLPELTAHLLEREGEKLARRVALGLQLLTNGALRGLVNAPALDLDSLHGLTVIHTGNLNSDDEAMLFLARLFERLTHWMRARPVRSRRLLVFLDEVAGILPPTAKPLPKTPLLTLLRQGRKFGVGVILASQSPGDLDYKGLGQARAWLIGCMATQQEVAKVSDRIRAMAPRQWEAIASSLYGLPAGHFHLLTPDSVQQVRIAPLLSHHVRLEPNQLDRLVRRQRKVLR